MSRPTKCRKVCHFPGTLEFQPKKGKSDLPPVVMTVDEYETIRLIDKEGLSQEACGASMQVARATVQKVYESARKKLADCLVDGRALFIKGGDFRLCDGRGDDCGRDDCFKQTVHRQYKKPKGESIMRVAITYENGEIYQHFGHTSAFKVYDIQNGKILSSEVVDTAGQGHGALAGVLNALNADVLICGGIGGGAQEALTAAGIRWYGGVSGNADEAAASFAAGKLDYDPQARCTHHDGEAHTCGSHGCGGHD
jgi:predicted DNA-binding protein (UPF0251 family)/predicted Fe-Mo cluster-binding NifX family protein